MIHFIKINPLHLLLPILASSVFLSCKDDLTIAIQPVPGSDDEVLVELPIELEDSEDGYALSAATPRPGPRIMAVPWTCN